MNVFEQHNDMYMKVFRVEAELTTKKHFLPL